MMNRKKMGGFFKKLGKNGFGGKVVFWYGGQLQGW
jgi:hypothetical protein